MLFLSDSESQLGTVIIGGKGGLQVLLNGLIGVFSNAFATDEPPDTAEVVNPPPPPPPPSAAARTVVAKKKPEDPGVAVATARRRLRKALPAPLFWTLRAVYTALAVAEPLAVGLCPLLDDDTSWARLQILLLALSTGLYAAQMAATFRFLDETVSAGAAGAAGRLRLLMLDGASLFETVCLVLGWALVVERPGMAALRCFRLFRVLWFFDLAGARRRTARSAGRLVSPVQLCYLTVEVVPRMSRHCFLARRSGQLT